MGDVGDVGNDEFFGEKLVMWLLRGKDFPPHPHFFSLCGEFGAMGKFPPGLRRRLCRLTCPPLAANSSSRAGARYGRGPALRCVHLRRIYSLLLCLAAKEFVHIRSAALTALVVPGRSVAGGVQTPDVARLLSLTFCPVQQSSFRAGSIREPISAIFLLSTTKGKLRNSPPGATRSGRRFGGGAKRPPPNSLSP